MKFIPSIATGPPVLDEETFQRLLAAAHIMQECNDRHIDASKVDNPCLAGSTTAENAPPIQVLPLALQAQVPKVNPVQDVIPEARTDVEPWAARRDALIPPQTASQLAALASQLQVALADVQTDSGLNTRPPTAVAPETSAERKQTAALHGGIQEEASFGQPTSEPTQLPLLQSGGGTIILPHKILRWPISIKNLLLRTARMVAIAALLGVLLHRLLLLPGGLALNRFRSTYSSAQVVSEIQNRIRADRRLQMTRVQVRASNGIITLSGDVGSSAERVAAVQNATQIKGIRVIVDNLRVMDSNRQSPNAALGASVVRTATRSKAPRARAFHVAVPADSLRPPSLSETIGVSSSRRTAGVGASASFPATPVRAPEQVTLPYDTVLAVRMKESLSSDLNHRGDTFLATLASPVMVDDRVVIPAEAAIQGKIVDVRNAGRFNGRSALVITLTSLGYNGRSYELRSSQYSKQSVSRNTHTAAAIGGGAGVGAIIGVILGGERGAAIGAVIGAGAGTAAQAMSKAAQVRLPADSTLSVRLKSPVTVIPSSTLIKSAERKLGTFGHGVGNG